MDDRHADAAMADFIDDSGLVPLTALTTAASEDVAAEDLGTTTGGRVGFGGDIVRTTAVAGEGHSVAGTIDGSASLPDSVSESGEERTESNGVAHDEGPNSDNDDSGTTAGGGSSITLAGAEGGADGRVRTGSGCPDRVWMTQEDEELSVKQPEVDHNIFALVELRPHTC